MVIANAVPGWYYYQLWMMLTCYLQFLFLVLKEERRIEIRKKITYFVLLMKSHLQSYPCPLQINYFWNWGFLLGITIILQIITGIFLGLHYTSDLNSAYSSVFFFIREILRLQK
jgi:quinol-cytochrome oxidoreductase complex cytochrome b subunit